MLGILGGIQVAGATAWLYGVAVPHYGLKHDTWTSLTLTPFVARSTTGATVLGRF
ncbi:MAG TPA: hypothetical protein VGQ57_02555 [Polyangiaceae bacterium]|nr:hypothetical protein [Polyangiaceae bacterium]